MASENSKARSKVFSLDEVMTLVDLMEANKSSLFGALSSSLTMDDKNKVWQDIARKLSEQHGQMRTRDDVSKKWYNILSKHKPRIADKIASAKKTGGGPADAQLDELELKISSIKGRECFEGIESGIDLTMSSVGAGDEILMVTSPTPSTASQNSERKFFLGKRKYSDQEGYEDIKSSLLDNEEEKKTLLRGIDSKLERLDTRFGQIVGLLERIANDQAKMYSLLASQAHPSFTPPPSLFPPSSFHMPLYYPPNQD